MSGDCQKCKRWQLCPGVQAWFHYGEIRFCPYQVLWIIQNSATFSAGNWPPRHEADAPIRRSQLIREGYFVKPEIILGEVRARLAATNADGYVLIAEAGAGNGIEELSERAYLALMYCKGQDRKMLTYSAWKKQRQYRNKGVTK